MEGDVEPNIMIKTFTRKEPIVLGPKCICLVEDLVIHASKICKIGPVARHLFSLWCPETNVWLSPSRLIGMDKKWSLHFKMRFRLPCIFNIELLGDLAALDYCFLQIRSDFMAGRIPEVVNHKNKALGLGATDMIREMLEKKQTLDELRRKYKEFIPKDLWKKHLFCLKEPLLASASRGLINSNKNIPHVKEQFIRQVCEIAPEYCSEEYPAQVDENGKVWEATLQINPFHPTQPGLRMLPKPTKSKWIHICSITDLYFISKKDNKVELSRKNGIPKYFGFKSIDIMQSFISCLEGYYRLMEKWTFNLCKEFPTPSLLQLKNLKSHGPVGYNFSCEKMRTKRNFEVGSFLIRECSTSYNEFRIDVCVKKDESPLTLQVLQDPSGKFKEIKADDKTDFDTIIQLAHHGLKQFGVTQEPVCITPSEYDVIQLLYIRPSSGEKTNHMLTTQRECSCKSQCIAASAVSIGLNQEMNGRFSVVYPSFLRRSGGDDKPIAIKTLLPEFHISHMEEFLEQSNRMLQWNSESIVPTLGMILHNPLALVMEYLQLGPLDKYLRSKANNLKQVDLIEASIHIARALWYLEEQGHYHGNIRCHNILVAEHNENSFKVQLGDPGILLYRQEDIPWLPPEVTLDMTSNALSSQADVWAFGTTLWEIFSYGEYPVIHEYQNNSVIDRQMLPMPNDCLEEIYKVMVECWNHDPDSRKQPQAIMRDINQTLYEVYNSRKTHSYATIFASYPVQSPQPISTPVNLDTNSSSHGVTLRLLQNPFNISISPGYGHLSEYSSSSEHSVLTTTSDVDSSSNCSQISIGSFGSLERRKSEIQDIHNTMVDPSEGSLWVIDINNLTMGQTLGQGFYGEVCKASLCQWEGLSKETVAVKRIKKSVLSVAGMKDLLHEINIMQSLSHRNIVEIKGLVEEPETLLVMEYLEKGSLLAYLQMHRKKLSTSTLLCFAYNIAEGMEYLEKKHIVHRDLASRNILVASPNHVKISDFGLAQFTVNQYYLVKTERNLPIRWYAPESIKYGKFSHKSDVWSYGVTLWEMFSYGKNPEFENISDNNLAQALEEGKRLLKPDDCPSEIFSLMEACWLWDPHKRPSFSEIMEVIQVPNC